MIVKKKDSAREILMLDRMSQILGFQWRDLLHVHSFTMLLHRPMDPSSLAVMRILFGFLMLLDIPQERGLSHADYKWGDPLECRFPLFDFMILPPLEWVYVMYLFMILGAFGIMLGFVFRWSCVCFLVSYWYLFLMDKTSWNNHSYLYGLLALLLSISDANRFLSIDSLRNPAISNSHVPLWNYSMLRAQVFLVYCIAGLKKTEYDWIAGYSMYNLASHWTFSPFKMFLSEEFINYYVVHLGGFLLDLTIGFFMFLDFSRPYAFVFCAMFNFMNSQIFTIGMFPFVMIATMPIFCYADWPRKWILKLPRRLQKRFCINEEIKPSKHCLYSPTQKPHSKKEYPKDRCQLNIRHKSAVYGVVCYLALQLFLPYSHFITKGYNNWTNGLYGYSWDMMVHSWTTLHLRVTVLDHDTGHHYYLNPNNWTQSDRWASHADMAKQYALCIQKNLAEHYAMNNVSVYLDVWKSVNRRFQQRFFDPHTDIIRAPWTPFDEVSWVMPLLTQLSNWREKLKEMELQLVNKSSLLNVVFIADFPGLTIENFISGDLINVTLEVLDGEGRIEYPGSSNTSLKIGDIIQEYELKPIHKSENSTSEHRSKHRQEWHINLNTVCLNRYGLTSTPTGTIIIQIHLPVKASSFHSIHTVSVRPACYLYRFYNATEIQLHESQKSTPNVTSPQQSESGNKSHWKTAVLHRHLTFWKSKYKLFERSFLMIWKSLRSIITGTELLARQDI